MQEMFIKESKIIEQSKKEKEEELLKSVKYSKKNLLDMYKNLDLAEGELVDYYIYRIKAEEAKYDYLIRKIKKNQNEKNV